MRYNINERAEKSGNITCDIERDEKETREIRPRHSTERNTVSMQQVVEEAIRRCLIQVVIEGIIMRL